MAAPVLSLGFWGQNSMLVITVDRGIPARSSLLLPFSPNIVPAPESHRASPCSSRFLESWHSHILFGRSFSFLLKWHFHLFGQIEKADLHEPLAERIEIPFQSKKSCKSALLQSRSLFVCRPVNRLKTRGTASAFGSSRSVSGSSGVPQPVA